MIASSPNSPQKQNRNTHSLHLKQKQPHPANKKYILHAPQHSRNPFNTYLLTHKSTYNNSSLHLAKKSEAELSCRNATHPQMCKNDGQWKNRRFEENNQEKYVPFKNDERIKEIFSSSKEYLPPKSREQTRAHPETSNKNSRNKQASITSKLLIDCNPVKKNNFTINMKELRKRKKRQVKNDTVNCRVVNLFESIEQKIKPIHQQDNGATQMKNISLKDYLGKISQALERSQPNEQLEKGCIDSANASLQPQPLYYYDVIHTISQAPPKLNLKDLPARQPRKSKQQARSCEKKEFQLKPWSTREIIVDL